MLFKWSLWILNLFFICILIYSCLQWTLSAVCTCSVSWRPSAPLCDLSSSSLPQITLCFQESLSFLCITCGYIKLCDWYICRHLLQEHARTPSAVSILQQMVFPCPTFPGRFSSLPGAHGQSHSKELLWWRAWTKSLAFPFLCSANYSEEN